MHVGGSRSQLTMFNVVDHDQGVLPMLQRLVADPYGIYDVVLTPTRELAKQIPRQAASGARGG